MNEKLFRRKKIENPLKIMDFRKTRQIEGCQFSVDSRRSTIIGQPKNAQIRLCVLFFFFKNTLDDVNVLYQMYFMYFATFCFMASL